MFPFVSILWLASALAGTEPDAAEIIRKLAERAEDPELVQRRNAVAYDRSSRVDYLNEEHEVRKQVTRVYKVTPVNGKPVTRLVSINGRPPRGDEDDRRSSARETGEKSRRLGLSDDLLGRYDFKLVGEEWIEGRRAWMLRFQAKASVEKDGFFDKLLEAMTGVIWVDAEDYQLAKAEIFLGRKVSFFGGFVGAIERLDLTLVQRRLEPGVWLSEAVFIDFSGRKLFSSVRFRCYETCTNFQQVETKME